MEIKRKNIKTAHGSIITPAFLPDATRGYIKTLDNNDLKKVGVKSMVVNTYHLYLQPGLKVIKKAGGIHNFMNWQGPLISDSGGYQVFSLIYKNPEMGKIFNDKVVFKSPLDGSKHELTPEKSIQIQFDLGTDVMICLDDCPPNDSNEKLLKLSVERTISWAKKCKQEYERQIKKRKNKNKIKPKLIAVVQGGTNFNLRKYCLEELLKIGFDGYGFGGRHIDSKGKIMLKMLKFTADLIPDNLIKFALGIGAPKDIVICAELGWNMFDCVMPTREGRHGKLFFHNSTKRNKNSFKTINIKNSIYKSDLKPINSLSRLPELKNNSKAYLHHLFKTEGGQGGKLASLNNLEFYFILIDSLVKNIKSNLI